MPIKTHMTLNIIIQNKTVDMIEIRTIPDIALAIVGIFTLILLYRQTTLMNIQMKEANKLARSNAYQNRYELFLEMDKLIITNPELKKLISTPYYYKQTLNNHITNNQAKELAFIEMVLNLCQLVFYQVNDGLKEGDMEWVKQVLNNPAVVSYWKNEQMRCVYDHEFEIFVNQNINQDGADL